MKTIISYNLPILIFTCIIISACTTTTQITGTWKNKKIEAPVYKNIFVAALTHDINARKIVENEMAVHFRDKGVNVTTSMELYGPITREEAGSREEIVAKVRENGNDAILTLSLVNAETETRYVPGNNNYYAPTLAYNFYGTFDNYYDYYYPQLYDPGYYANDKVYFLESNLYDMASKELLWSAQSQSYSPGDIENFAEEFSEVTTARLHKEKLIP
jgi:hypothetical protein